MSALGLTRKEAQAALKLLTAAELEWARKLPPREAAVLLQLKLRLGAREVGADGWPL